MILNLRFISAISSSGNLEPGPDLIGYCGRKLTFEHVVRVAVAVRCVCVLCVCVSCVVCVVVLVHGNNFAPVTPRASWSTSFYRCGQPRHAQRWMRSHNVSPYVASR